MEVKEISVTKLKENKWNPNKLQKRLFETLTKNIEKYGMIQPILVNEDNVIIDGAHRLKAAKKAGIKKVWCVVLDIAEVDAKLQTLAMNKIHGFPDEIFLADIFSELISVEKIQMNEISTLTGFEEKEIVKVINPLQKYMADEKEYDENIKIENKCPKCGYEW